MNKTHKDYQILPIPPLPDTQALSCSTFKRPPLDGSLNLSEVCVWNGRNNPEHPIFVYADQDGGEHVIRWQEFVRGIHRVSSLVQRIVTTSQKEGNASPRTIAILSLGDTVTYITTIFGILESGNVAFPVSVRNSPAAVAHLLEATDTDFLLVGSDQAHQSLANSSLQVQQCSKPAVFPLFEFDEIFSDGDEKIEFTTTTVTRPNMESPAVILHSSGSTSFPKPIRWSHYGLVQQCIAPYFGEIDFAGVRVACHAIPPFHSMCLVHACFAAGTGLVFGAFDPRSITSQPTPDKFMRGIVDSKCDFVLAVPSFIEAWSTNEDQIERLKRMRGVMNGGGPLNHSIGDNLRDKGVRLYNVYGCTEGVVVGQYLRASPCFEWEYLAFSKAMDLKLIPQDEDRFELVIKPGPYAMPFVFNTTIEGEQGYATGDLFIPHPSKPGLFKLYGRADDQIVHSSGEKTNPGPLEGIINQDPLIQSSIIFGRGKFNAGILVNPVPSESVEPSDERALSSYRNKIWPTVQKMNEYAPQHSRIFKEMILVSKQIKPFAFTAKGTVRRQVTLNDYADEIDELYSSVDRTTALDIAPPALWTPEELIALARKVVGGVMAKPMGDDDDFFHHGCDSLQAAWMRNTILTMLSHAPNLDIRDIPMNFVYSYPTISGLTNYFLKLMGFDGETSAVDNVEARVENMLAMVRKYTHDFPKHTPSDSTSFSEESGIVVVLTGTTGGLGSSLLWKLLEIPQVSRVYALNRRGSGDLAERQRAAFLKRGYNTGLMSSKKLTMLDGDLGSARLGLEEGVYSEIRDSVTHIIHNAYTVNFNLSLASFEPNVLGLRQLVDLALSSRRHSPPRLIFTSSIGTVLNYEGAGPVPEDPVNAKCAVGTGYSESKWVCEEILSIATAESALQPITVRVGQLCGASTNGFWNPKEWVPSLFKSSALIGCLPKLDAEISWIPVDVAAQVLLELLDSKVPILHLVHSQPVKWSSLFDPAGTMLGLHLVSYRDWLEGLEANAVDVSAERSVGVDENPTNPALEIIDFFRSSLSSLPTSPVNEDEQNASEAFSVKRLCLERTLDESASLRNCPPLSVDDLSQWLKCWNLGDL
ncbi:acetyl-CoA synthetase-like protein [Schizopora paradoxa]|uniref:Acetyl-CoA synthetase-like protein n=1 Tax=Schizopora paradoxa TaxID=27342 RepID=A0A0H2RC28_9AGAM|nr:acetyl-CoA synthetase-like protein [Schizopora paradoxa]